MNLLQYGPVFLNLVSVKSYTRQAVYSGPNYLYHRHRLQVVATLNPGTQKNLYDGSPTIGPDGQLGLPFVYDVPLVRQPATFRPQPVAGPPRFGGNVPGVSSDTAIRHLLLQPRQQLVYSVLGAPALISPLPGFLTDVTGGPFPQSCDVEEVGPRNFVITFDVQTDVNETTQFFGQSQLPVVLAHSWTMEHQIDDKWFTARVIEGRITFRKDLLGVLDAGLNQPDDYRSLLFHPVPANCKRESVLVKAEDDGCTIRYRIVDRELPYGWPNPNISKVEASHSYATGTLGLYEIIGRISIADPGRLIDIAPVTAHHIQVRAWGIRGRGVVTPENYCTAFINARIAALKNARPSAIYGGVGISFKYHLTDNSVEASTILKGPPTVNDGIPLTFFSRVGPDVTVGPDQTGRVVPLLSDVSVFNPGPPDDQLSRGTMLERVVGSALQPPLAAPLTPPNTPGIRTGLGLGFPVAPPRVG